MYEFSSGVDAQLTNKVNYNAEFSYNIIDVMKDITSSLKTEINDIATANSDTTMTTVPSNLANYIELTQPNIESVNQLNSIFDMWYDGTTAEVTRINDIFTKTNEQLVNNHGGSALPSSMLADTSLLTKYSMSTGIDTSLSNKWNTNFLDTKDMIDLSTSNILESAKDIIYIHWDASLPNSLTTKTGLAGNYTTDLYTINWGDILPDFNAFYHAQKLNSTDTITQVAYSNNNDQIVIGHFDIINETFETKAFVPISATSFDPDAWASSNGWDWAVSERNKYIYNESEDKVAVIKYFRVDDGASPEADSEVWAKSFIFTSGGELLNSIDPFSVTEDQNDDDKIFSFYTPSTEVIFYDDGTTTRLGEIIGHRSDDDTSRADGYYFFSSYINISFSTNSISGGHTPIVSAEAGDDGNESHGLSYTYHNGVLIIGAFVETDGTDGYEDNTWAIYRRDLSGTVGSTHLLTDNDSTAGGRAYQGVYSHYNMLNMYISIYDTINDEDFDFKLWNYVDDTLVYSQDKFIDQDPIGGPNVSLNPQPNGTELYVLLDFENSVYNYGPIRKFIGIDGTVGDMSNVNDVLSTASISSVNNWIEVSGEYKPIAWDSSAFYKQYLSTYTVTHTVPVSLNNPSVIYATNRPFINSYSRFYYSNNDIITNDYGQSENGSTGFMVAGDTNPTSIDVSYSLTGYPLNNFTADRVFIIHK